MSSAILPDSLSLIAIAGFIAANGTAATINRTVGLVLFAFTGPIAATIAVQRRAVEFANTILRTAIAVFAGVAYSVAALTCRIAIAVACRVKAVSLAVAIFIYTIRAICLR